MKVSQLWNTRCILCSMSSHEPDTKIFFIFKKKIRTSSYTDGKRLDARIVIFLNIVFFPFIFFLKCRYQRGCTKDKDAMVLWSSFPYNISRTLSLCAYPQVGCLSALNVTGVYVCVRVRA